MSENKKDILVYGSCRLNFNLQKFNLIRPSSLSYIHSHFEILNIIETLQKNNFDASLLSQYSKLTNLNDNTKTNFFEEIKRHDIVIFELCSAKTYYEYEHNMYNNVSKIYEYFNTVPRSDQYLVLSNTSQKRDDIVENHFFRKDKIIISNKDLFYYIKIGNYIKNKEFVEINYNKTNELTELKIKNMPNNNFKSFSLSLDMSYDGLFSVKVFINCDAKEDIYIKYYNGTEHIYTDQTVNSEIILKDFRKNYLVGFYKKNEQGEILTSSMLKETGNFYWNINFNIQSYEIIINDLQEINIDKTIPKQFYLARDMTNFKDTFDKFLNYFKGKKIIFISHLVIKDNNNEKIINNYVNTSRLKLIDFLKEIIPTESNCYFFENYVTNDLLKDDNHLNSYGYEKVGEKLEEFLKKIC